MMFFNALTFTNNEYALLQGSKSKSLYLKVSMQLLSCKPSKFVKEADSVNELEVGLLRICRGKVKPHGSGIRATACHVKYWPFRELSSRKRFV